MIKEVKKKPKNGYSFEYFDVTVTASTFDTIIRRFRWTYYSFLEWKKHPWSKQPFPGFGYDFEDQYAIEIFDKGKFRSHGRSESGRWQKINEIFQRDDVWSTKKEAIEYAKKECIRLATHLREEAEYTLHRAESYEQLSKKIK